MVHDLQRFSIAGDRLLRDSRLDRIAEGKARLWKASLRLSQLANGLILGIAIPFLIWRNWALWASIGAAGFTVTAMWCFARWMGQREQRLCRHMAFLARHRRTCACCDYALHHLVSRRCPECGAPFDPDDTRHVLTSETVRLYSARARVISGVIIVFALVWVSTMARRAPWPIHAALFLALLFAFHALHLYWLWQAGRTERSQPDDHAAIAANVGVDTPDDRSASRRCTDCDAILCGLSGAVPESCPGCHRGLVYGEVFIRPDVRRLSDRRITSIQYHSLLLRWFFFLSVCGGLAVLTQVDLSAFGRVFVVGGRAVRFLEIVLPVVLWVALATALFRRRARLLHRRLRQLFAEIAPTCPRCDHDLSTVPVHQACPGCRRVVQERWIVG